MTGLSVVAVIANNEAQGSQALLQRWWQEVQSAGCAG